MSFFPLISIISYIITLAIRKSIAIGSKTFFARKQATLGLKITNAHRTAKVLGSNLTASCFFFQTRNITFQKNCRLIICLICFVGLDATSENCFLLYASYIVVVCSLLLYFCCLQLY